MADGDIILTTPGGQSVILEGSNDSEIVLEAGGLAGPDGQGVPSGGTAGQLLTKVSSTPFDTAWRNLTPVDVGAPFINVTDYGAVGDGVADDTASIQAAIDTAHSSGNAVVYLLPGTYKITRVLTVYTGTSLQGSGRESTCIRQTNPGQGGLYGRDVASVKLVDLFIEGPASGSGIGIDFGWTTAGNLPFLSFQNILVKSFGSDGIRLQTPIVSSFINVTSQANTVHGFNLTEGGTSNTFESCWTRENGEAGYRFHETVYTNLSGCAADNNGIGYYVQDAQSIGFFGCGAEGSVNNGGFWNGTNWLFDNSSLCVLSACWVTNNRNLGVYIYNGSNGIELGIADNTPNTDTPPTAFIKSDTGTNLTITSLHNTTVNSLAAGTATILNDGAGGVSTSKIYTDYIGGFADPNVNLDINATMLGSLTLNADPTSSLQAATKRYVDNRAEVLRTVTKTVVPVPMQGDYIFTPGAGGTAETQINAAIAAVDTAGGGTVFIRGNPYISHLPILYNYVPTNPLHIRGESKSATKISVDSTLNYGVFDNYAASTFDNPTHNLIISDMEIDGTGFSRSSGQYKKGINSRNWYYCMVQNVNCHDCTATGIGPDNLYMSIIDHCDASNNGTVATAARSTLTSDNTNVSAGNTVVVGELYASALLTATSIPHDADSVTLDVTTYTFRTTLTGAAYDVLIGSSAAIALDNLMAAINAGKGAGTLYGTGTAIHPTITATTNTATTQKFAAKLNGTGGNSINTATSAGGRVAFGGGGTTGGTDTTYTFVSSLSLPYDILIGATADDSLTNLAQAINGSAGEGTLYGTGTIVSDVVSAGTVAGHALVVSALNGGTSGNTITVSETSAHLSFDHSPLSDGQNQLIGHNGIGIASGGLPNESFIVSSCTASGNANNDYLVEADTNNTGADAQYLFINCISDSSKGNAFRNTGTPNVSYIGCKVYAPAKSGFYTSNATLSHLATNTLIQGGTVIGAGVYGIYQGATNDGFTVDTTTVANCVSDGIICGASVGTISHVKSHDNGRYGVNLGAFSGSTSGLSDVTLDGVYVWNNAKITANTDGLFVHANNNTLSNITIAHSRAFDNQSVKTQRYGLILPTSSGGYAMTNILVDDNNFVGNGTAGFLKQNTSESITVGSNIGYNPNSPHALGSVSGAITIAAINGNVQTATLIGNISPAFTAGTVIGQTITCIFSQDPTGGWTLTLPSNVKPAQSSVGFVLSTAANSVDSFTVMWDGTNWRELSRALSTTKLTIREGLTLVAGSASNLVPLSVTQSDTTNNPNMMTSTNNGTGHGYQLTQAGVLAANKYAQFIDSAAAQINSPLVRFRQNSASSTTDTLQLDNAGTGAALLINSGNLKFTAGMNLTASTVTGSMVGLSTSEKWGFYGTTPVVQQTAVTDLGTALSNLGLRAAGSAYPITTSGAVAFSGAVTLSSTLIVTGGTRNVPINRTSNITLTTGSPQYETCDATTAPFTVTLPATTLAGILFTFIKTDAGANAVTIAGTINGATNYLLSAQYARVTIQSTSVSGVWLIMGT